jgi:hypothetical protein
MRQRFLDAYTEPSGFWKRDTFVEDCDGVYIKTEYDTDSVLAAAKAISEQTPGKDLRHVAVIPPEVLDRAYREGWFHDKAKWKQWANDPNNKHLRTWNGRI